MMSRLLGLTVFCLLMCQVLSQEASPVNNGDLCKSMKCKKPRGSWCQVVDVDGVPTPKCVCPDNCDGQPDAPVCSVFGKQYSNLCTFHKYSCKKRKSIPLAFEKPCIASQAVCTAEEYSQFPYRILEWFMHLKEKNEFGRIDPTRRISYLDTDTRETVATWKFDELDVDENDLLDKRELLRFRYALMPLEHCASAFFTRCAKKDGDMKRISLEEWMDCLKIYDPEVEDQVAQAQEVVDPQEPIVEEEDEEVEEEDEEEDAPEETA